MAATVAQVASYIRARTKTQGGEELGTFAPAASWNDGSGEGTRPNAEQVTSLISDFGADFFPIFGVVPDAPGEDPEAYRTAVDRLAALGTAMLVELTYWPEQVATGRSPYDQLKALFDERMLRLLKALGLDDDGDGLPDDSDPLSQLPSYGGFPVTGIGMEMYW